MKISIRSTIAETVTVLLIMLFLYTGISKLSDYLVFKEQIAQSPALEPISAIVATTLPWVELGVVILLAIPRWRLKGLYASLFLLLIFTAYILLILAFDKHLPCSCGGIISQLSWNQHLFFNGTFIALTVSGISQEKSLKLANHKVLSSIIENYVARTDKH
jgi:uncharacterized membrane protein YphA (DoxX/SURF4 family)